MEKIAVKLLQPENDVSFFEENQVLTAEQLNLVVNYFDYQERLTRSRLIGNGIVCGLSVSFTGSAITVTPGCGLTSDGDLIVIENEQVYSQAVLWDDTKAHYPPFFPDGTNQIELWRLLPSATEDEDAQPLGSFFTG